MAVLSLTVNDDAHQLKSGNAGVLGSSSIILGTSGTQASWAGFRFISATIPNAATIRSAVIRINLSSISGSSTFRIAGEAADNAAAFTTGVNDLSGRTLTTNEAVVNSRTDEQPNGYYELDVTATVQAIVNRAGWSSGNAIVIMVNTPSGLSAATIAFSEDGATDDPQLRVVYDGSVTTELGSGAEENVDAGWTNISNIRTDNGTSATGTNMSTNEAFTAKTFGIPDLTGSTIDNVRIQIECSSSAVSVKERLGVELSWDGGTSWSTKKYTLQMATSLEKHYLHTGPGGWGHTFVPNDLTDANFRVRITPDSATSTSDYSVDFVAVRVEYTTASGPQPSVNDAITVSESVTMRVNMLPSVSDSVTVSDVLTDIIRGNIRNPQVSDSITVTESITMRVFDLPSVSDAVTVSENIALVVKDLPSVNDSVTVTDVPVVEIRVTPLVSDTITYRNP